MVVKTVSTQSPLGTEIRNASLVEDAKLQALDCLIWVLSYHLFTLQLILTTKSYIATSWIYFSALHPQVPKAYFTEARWLSSLKHRLVAE